MALSPVLLESGHEPSVRDIGHGKGERKLLLIKCQYSRLITGTILSNSHHTLGIDINVPFYRWEIEAERSQAARGQG